MRIEEIRDLAGLEALREEWADLWDRCPRATPFQSFEWLLPWARAFVHEGLQTLALREGRLAALAPLYRYGRRLYLLGNGITDYLDFLVEPGMEAHAVRAVFDHLVSSHDDWDACDFADLRPGSPLLRAALPEGLRALAEPGAVCPVLALPAGSGPNLRRNLRRYRERLSRAAAPVAFETARENYGETLEALFRLHRERWRARGGPGVLDTADIRDFHRAVAAGFASRGRLRLYSLRAAGEIVAAIYAFAARGRVYLYSGGFDPKLRNFSPGALAIGYAIEDASREGFRELDFLRGGESYKYQWGAQDTRNYKLLVERGTGLKRLHGFECR